MKLIYTRPDGGVSVVLPTPKEMIEEVLGPLTTQEYLDHINVRSIPKDAISVREVSDEDLPSDREFRDAWVDVTEDTKINIDVSKALDIKLAGLREVRNLRLAALDVETLKALESGTGIELIAAKKRALRQATDPLKALDVEGKIDDADLLNEIKRLAVLPEDV